MKKLFTILFLSFCWLIPKAQPCLDVSLAITDIVCYDEATGQVEITINNGQAPYIIWWNDEEILSSQFPFLIDSLSAGTYELSITDSNACSYEATLELLHAPEIIHQVSGFPCGGCWCFTADVLGGIPPYTYEWSNGDSLDFIIYCEIEPYYVTITDANGCSVEDGITIAVVSVPFGLSHFNIEPVSCYGACDASIDVEIFGGVPPYKYQWSNGAKVQDPDELCGGAHYLTIVDANSQFYKTSFIVAEPNEYIFETVDIFPSTNCDATCDGYIYGAIEGGVPPYTFAWEGPDGFSANSEDILNLCEGLYHLSVTDSTDCILMKTYEITCLSPLAVQIEIEQPSCMECCDGSILIIPNGGLAPYEYSWNSAINNSYIDGLCEGLNTLIVTDSLGNQVEIEVLLENPSSVSTSSLLVTLGLAPNPVNDMLNISFTTKSVHQWDIKLMNTTGELFTSFVENKYYPIGDHQVKMPMSKLARGVYLVCFYAKNELVRTLKVVKL